MLCQFVLQEPLVTHIQMDVTVTMDTRAQTCMVFVQMRVRMDFMVYNANYLVRKTYMNVDDS